MIYKKDIEKIKQIIYNIEIECGYTGMGNLVSSSVDIAIYDIVTYLSDRGYKIYKKVEK